MTTREGRWLCRQCGGENLGRFEECNGLDGESGCGAARSSDVRFYLPANSPIVTDPALLDDAESGNDWNCDHCDGANKGSYLGQRIVKCGHCGNLRDHEDKDYQGAVYSIAETPRSDADTLPQRAPRRKTERQTTYRETQTHQTSRSTPRRASKTRSGYGLFALGALIVVIVALCAFFLRSTEKEARVVAHAWKRTIQIEHFVTLEKQGWSHPDDARVTFEETRYKEDKKVFSHYKDIIRTEMKSKVVGTKMVDCGVEDLGNGFFKDKKCPKDITTMVPVDVPDKEAVYNNVPVYATWYKYEIDRWREARVLRASNRDVRAYWPEHEPLKHNEREGKRTESYLLYLSVNEEEPQELSVPYADWADHRDGRTALVDVSPFGTIEALVPRTSY